MKLQPSNTAVVSILNVQSAEKLCRLLTLHSLQVRIIQTKTVKLK